MPSWTALSTDIAAIGALGTAAFGLVDAFKALPGGGISRAGFKFIRQILVTLTPPDPALDAGGLSRVSIINTMTSHWINGGDTASQISIAKSLIKLRMTPTTAPGLAAATGVSPAALTQVATNIADGTPLTEQQTDAYGRFDLMLSTLLDQAYQRAQQRYRNTAKIAAVPISIILAIVASKVLPDAYTITMPEAVLLGLIATPIAPIAKDLATAVTSGAQALQTLKS